MSKLFISFTSTVSALARGTISRDDFKNGLFYFGCTRTHAINPGENGEVDETTWATGDITKQAEIKALLRKELEAAEAQGRVEWRTVDGINSFDQLNKLLAQNGAQLINPLELSECRRSYCYSAVRELAKKVGHEVIGG